MLIEMHDIKKEYKGRSSAPFMALKGITLGIKNGEMIAIKGPSGAGKSTLLHVIGCLDKPTGGMYMLNGINMSAVSSNDLAKARNKTFGFVMQNFALIEEDTVLQNVTVPLLFAKTTLSLTDKMAADQLAAFGIGNLAKKRVSKLSGGEKQRVAIARALINNPDIILADEPTGAIDKANARVVMQALRQLNDRGKTVLIITHDDSVADYCQRIINIEDGRLK